MWRPPAGTVIILGVLAGIKPLEERYRRGLQTRNLTLLAKRGQFSIDILRDVAGPHAERVQQFVLRPSGTDDLDEVEVVFGRLLGPAFQDIIQKLKQLPGVTQVETPDLS